jgi:hypothetical protein
MHSFTGCKMQVQIKNIIPVCLSVCLDITELLSRFTWTLLRGVHIKSCQLNVALVGYSSKIISTGYTNETFINFLKNLSSFKIFICIDLIKIRTFIPYIRWKSNFLLYGYYVSSVPVGDFWLITVTRQILQFLHTKECTEFFFNVWVY